MDGTEEGKIPEAGIYQRTGINDGDGAEYKKDGKAVIQRRIHKASPGGPTAWGIVSFKDIF